MHSTSLQYMRYLCNISQAQVTYILNTVLSVTSGQLWMNLLNDSMTRKYSQTCQCFGTNRLIELFNESLIHSEIKLCFLNLSLFRSQLVRSWHSEMHWFWMHWFKEQFNDSLIMTQTHFRFRPHLSWSIKEVKQYLHVFKKKTFRF